ncbi:MAG: ATP-binding cassette domain-containing protein [Acidimicrobiales bacterium]
MTAEAVVKSFDGRPVIDVGDVRLGPRECVALVGPSGSGKSTLLGLLAGELRPDGGRVRWIDDDGVDGPPRPSDIAWVAQGGNSLLARSAIDNAALGALSRGCDVTSARRSAAEWLDRLGLGHLAEQRVVALSGGERQRVAFARALAAGAGAVFADEPTANLDPSSAATVIDTLRDVGAAHLVVLATHDPNLAAVADRVLTPSDWGAGT